MNKLFIASFFVLIASCGMEEPEVFTLLPEDTPACWTVDGDPELYFHVLLTHSVNEEFYTQCENMHRETFNH